MAVAAACALGLIACSEPPESGNARALARVAPAEMQPRGASLGERVAALWHVFPFERRGDGLVAVRLGDVRHPARVVRPPARLVAPLPEGTRELAFFVSPPLRESGGATCRVTLQLSWAGVGIEPTQALVTPDEGAGRWLPVVLPVPANAQSSPLWIDLEPDPACAGDAVVAVSELEPRGAAPPPHRPNLLLVVIDTLRRDLLACDASTASWAPNLTRRWCERGLFFEEAITTAPWTYPALASMLTGLRPREHGALRDGQGELGRSVATAAEVLRWHGYATAAVASNWHATRGLWRGFDRFAELLPGPTPEAAAKRRAARVVDAAIDWLDAEPRRPFFLWTLFIDLHEPVDAALELGAPPAACADIADLPLQWRGLGKPPDPPAPEQLQRMACRRALYGASLRYVDRELGRLMDALAARGLDRDTWVVVASDHGEEFWDHAAEEEHEDRGGRPMWGIGHGHTLYAELTRVPLLVVPPVGSGAHAGRSNALVSVEDVFGTLLGLARVAPPAAANAQDLSLAFSPGWRGARDYVASGATNYGPERAAVTTRELQAIWTAPDSVVVFDRRRDPQEQHPLEAGTDAFREGRRLLRRAFEQPATAPLSASDRAALEALGYLR